MSSRLTIEKMYQGEYWTNVYWLSTEFGSSASAANSIVAAERAVTRDAVLFTKYRVDDGVEDTDVFFTVSLNNFGLAAINSQTFLPLFNVVRVDFQAGAGRPSRKYLRGILTEDQVTFNTILSNVVDSIQTNYANAVAAVTAYVDVDEQDITGGTVYPFVGMRQLRRASKKKITQSSPTPV